LNAASLAFTSISADLFKRRTVSHVKFKWECTSNTGNE
jgi:hypothetical protein